MWLRRDTALRLAQVLFPSGLAVWLAGCTGLPGAARLPRQVYTDKCTGAWAGQMVGVTYGEPYQFQSNGRPILTPLAKWQPECVEAALRQDDVYAELTFLAALEKYGLDVTAEQAGRMFADAPYPLWHANLYGRENIRKGIMPPLSGAPPYNRHCDDIDFQMEADLFGVICPGLPKQSNRLCDLFGHIMNYGDGVYGGMFVAGMYCAAYFESRDIDKVLAAGLRCIPAESLYARCINDVIAWHRENPADWKATWKKIEDKWQDDIDCQPGDPFNIDAKLNGAYIVLAMLYGEGDMLKTMEIATRAGQDNDCNPSSAAGVLGCMKGYKALGDHLTGGIAQIENTNFVHTAYSFKTLIPACQRVVEMVVERAGGRVTSDACAIPVQEPMAPARLEQWTDQMKIIKAKAP